MAVPDPFGPQTGSGFETSDEIRPLTESDREDQAFSDLRRQRPTDSGPAVALPQEPEPLRPVSLEPARSDSLRPGALRPATERPDTLGSADERRAREARAMALPSSAPPYPYEGDLEDVRRQLPRPPAAPHRGSVPLSQMFPAVRPAAPGGRRVDWIGAESARHAVAPDTPPESPPPADESPLTGETSGARVAYDPATFPRRLPYEPAAPAESSFPAKPYDPPSPDGTESDFPAEPYESASPAGTESGFPAEPYESASPAGTESGFPARPYGSASRAGTESSFPARPYEPTSLAGTESGFAAPPNEPTSPAGTESSFPTQPYEPTSPAGTESGFSPLPTYPGALPGESVSGALPQRVPAEPDVPTVPEPPSVEPSAETPALARIATHLRRGDVLPAGERPEGFDVQAILAAVREVAGVRDASLRTTPQGAHSLRLDLAEGADPAEVSRQVARLLQDRMGLDAAMQDVPAAPPPPVSGSASVPFVPTQPVPTGRASVVPPARAPLPEFSEVRAAAASAPVSAPPAEAAGPVSPAAPVYAPGPSTTAGTTDSGLSDVDCGPARPLAVGERPGPRVIIENVQVNTFGTEATVEVRLGVGGQVAAGTATGPAVDGYLLRLCATATAHAVDELLSGTDHAAGPARCFVEHAASVPFGPLQVAVVVLLLSCGNWVEQLAGSAVVTGDDRHAVVRATLAAVNRRLEALLS